MPGTTSSARSTGGTARRRWRNVLEGRPTAGPLRVDSVVVVSGVSPNVDLFDAETGLPRGRYVAPSELAALPHVIPNAHPPSPNLILVTGTGEMVALATAAGPPTLTFGMPFEPLLPRPPEVGLADLVDWFPTSRPEAPATDPVMRPVPRSRRLVGAAGDVAVPRSGKIARCAARRGRESCLPPPSRPALVAGAGALIEPLRLGSSREASFERVQQQVRQRFFSRS